GCETMNLVSRQAITMSLRFVFYSPRVHLALHSFPTRRSSDLFMDDVETAKFGVLPPDPTQAAMARRYRAMLDANWRLEQQFGSRSEEHTSELQSPYELVCRLLLEKKKCTAWKTQSTTTNRING